MPVQLNGTAPYAPRKAIIEVLTRHRAGTLPTPVTQQTLTRIGVSESLAPRTLQALRLLDFVDAKGNPTPEFADLQKVSTADFKPRLGELLRAAYADVFAAVDPSNASYEQVHDAFRGFKPMGQIGRMVTLYLSLLAYVGQPTLPASTPGGKHLVPATPLKPLGQKPLVKPLPKPPTPPFIGSNAGNSRTVNLRNGGTLAITGSFNPLTLRGADRQFYSDLLDLLDKYESSEEP